MPNGLCVEVLCSFKRAVRVDQVDVRDLPLQLLEQFEFAAGERLLRRRCGSRRRPRTMCAWQVSYSTPKLVFPFARTPSTSFTISDGLLNAKPGSNSQQMFSP